MKPLNNARTFSAEYNVRDSLEAILRSGKRKRVPLYEPVVKISSLLLNTPL